MTTLAFSYLRMSSGKQLAGDSRRRQLEQSRAYAASRGLKLAEGAELEDIGISAYKGKNTKDGQLGWFLKQVELGKIPFGSYLLVESLDRISRQDPNESMSKFLAIINAGINLVTLFDDRIYKAPCSIEGLIIPLVILSRAHNESKEKGQRVAAAWQNKRKNAAERPMTKLCPKWMKLAPDGKSYLPIPDRVEIVQSIFRAAASGLGSYKITGNLNKAGKLSFGKRKSWQQSSVTKILSSKAVIGEFQPHRLQDGKRIPDGDPINAYFPQVVETQLFYQVQSGRAERKISGAGRKGETYANLFSGIIRCIYCKATVNFENKGGGRHGSTYLVCEGARRGLNCPSVRWKYQDFESSFLSLVEEIDLQSIMDAAPSDLEKLEAELAAFDGRLAGVRQNKRRVMQLFCSGGDSDLADETIRYIKSELDQLSRQEADLENESRKRRSELEVRKAHGFRCRSTKKELEELIARLQQSLINEDLYNLRAQIASRLKRLTKCVLVGSVGTKPSTLKACEWLRSNKFPGSESVASYMEENASHPRDSRRFFCVGFGNDCRIIYPDRDNPLQYDEQVLLSNLLRDMSELPFDVAKELGLAENLAPEVYFSMPR